MAGYGWMGTCQKRVPIKKKPKNNTAARHLRISFHQPHFRVPTSDSIMPRNVREARDVGETFDTVYRNTFSSFGKVREARTDRHIA